MNRDRPSRRHRLTVLAALLGLCLAGCTHVSNSTKRKTTGAVAGAVGAVFTFDSELLQLYVGDKPVASADLAPAAPAQPATP